MDGDSQNTALASFAYTRDTPENCVLPKNLIQNATMIHDILTTDQKENQFVFLYELNGTGKRLNIKFRVFLESIEVCGEPASL